MYCLDDTRGCNAGDDRVQKKKKKRKKYDSTMQERRKGTHSRKTELRSHGSRWKTYARLVLEKVFVKPGFGGAFMISNPTANNAIRL